MNPELKALPVDHRPRPSSWLRPGLALGLPLALLLAGPLPARSQTVEHVVVRKPPEGRGFMAPNNGGIWSWGDEILVMYVNGPHKNGTGCGSHSTQEGAPGTTYDTWDTGYPVATLRADGKVVVCYWLKTVNQDEPNYIGATIWDAARASSGATTASAPPPASGRLSARVTDNWAAQRYENRTGTARKLASPSCARSTSRRKARSTGGGLSRSRN